MRRRRIVRLSASDAPSSDYREFVAWLKRSPVHVAEYLRIEQTWASLGRVDVTKRIDVNTLLACPDASVVELLGACDSRNDSAKSRC